MPQISYLSQKGWRFFSQNMCSFNFYYYWTQKAYFLKGTLDSKSVMLVNIYSPNDKHLSCFTTVPDVWNFLYPMTKDFTYFSPSHQKHSHLDYSFTN